MKTKRNYNLINKKHLPNRKPWTDKEISIEALKYNSREDFRTKSYGAYQAAQRRKKLDYFCAHMKKSQTKAYTEEDLRNISSKCKTVGEFYKKHSGAYDAARKMGILNLIRSHMPPSPNEPYDNHELKEIALKYKTKGEFEKYNGGAYKAACIRGIINEICPHMKNGKDTSIPEIDLFNKIKELYPSAKKIRDRKANISGKPYIKGFDIDIFIPELNRGIEFDGVYYHSYEFIKKRKTKLGWPNKDIKNYHQIKDDYFLSKGIKLLHINEQDWVDDKEDCIKRCLRFLNDRN